jgi:hypothetical protein
MQVFQRLVLVLGATALLEAEVRAQPPRFTFSEAKPGWMDVEMLLQNASVARELKLDGRREMLARRAIFAALPWYTQEVQKVFTLPKDQQLPRQLELLDRYQQLQYKALGRVLTRNQLTRLKQIQVWVAGVDAFAQPWVQKELKLTADQKEKIESVAKEFAEAKKKNESLMEETLKNVLKPEQLNGLKMLRDAGAGLGAVSEPWAQKWLRLSPQQKEKVKALTKEVEEATKKEKTLLRETMKKATDVLAGEQRKKWEVVAGKPFQLQVRFAR